MAGESGSVWVFLGEDAHWPSAVFTTRDLAVQWIADNGVTGLLTEYPLDVGVYDWAVARGLFRPTKPAHSTPGFVARFTTAHQDHTHFASGVDD